MLRHANHGTPLHAALAPTTGQLNGPYNRDVVAETHGVARENCADAMTNLMDMIVTWQIVWMNNKDYLAMGLLIARRASE